MTLKWKTTKIGDRVITHWARHNPQEILKAANSIPVNAFPEADPAVAVRKFGKQFIATRTFHPPWDPVKAGMLFTMLRHTVEGKAAVVEMPVALIGGEKHPPTIVTLWKHPAVPLEDFLAEHELPLQLKINAAKAAMRRIATLHAAGFTHGHLKQENFVTTPRGHTQLVDFTGLAFGTPKQESFSGVKFKTSWLELLSEELAHNIYMHHPPEKKFRDVWGEKRAQKIYSLSKQLEKEYERHLKKEARRLGRPLPKREQAF